MFKKISIISKQVGDFFQNFVAFSEYLNFTYVIDSAARQKLEKKLVK